MSRSEHASKKPNVADTKAIPPLQSIRAFEAVGRLGGIRAAAASLDLDHSVISRHVRLLEDWLGTALFQRVGGRLNLTEAGARYHDRVAGALIELALASSEVKGGANQTQILVWCVPGFAAQWISDRVGAFEAAYPRYAVELRPTDSDANLPMHEADVDIRFYLDGRPPRANDRCAKYIELARPPIMIVASPSVARKYHGISVDELLNAPLLHEENDEQWRKWLSLNNVRSMPDRLSGTLLWHAHLAIAAARNNRGLALASKYLVDKDLRSGELVEVNVSGAEPVVTGAYSFVAREDRWSSEAIRAFRRFIQAEVKRFESPG